MKPSSNKPNQLLIQAVSVLGLAAVVTIVILNWQSPRDARRERIREQNVPSIDESQADSPMWLDPVSTPSVVTATDSKLTDETEVIGISVGDRHRAYSIAALSGVGEQVVNDVVNDMAITVVYSYRNNYIRVFGQPGRNKALRINVAAWIKQKLHVAYNGNQYTLDDPEFPVKDWAYQRTTWKTWRDRFPATEVYETAPNFLEDEGGADGPQWTIFESRIEAQSLPISFEYPEGWRITSSDRGGNIQLAPVKPTKTSPSYEIRSTYFTEATDTESYFRQTFDIDAAKKEYADLQLIESSIIQLGQYPTRHVVFQYTTAGQFRVAMVFTLWSRQGGCHLFASGPGKSRAWRSVCERVAGSLRLGKDPR